MPPALAATTLPTTARQATLANLRAMLRRKEASLDAEEEARLVRLGVEEVDALLPRGIRAGSLVSVEGRLGSGRASLALAAVARSSAEGRRAALIDATGLVHPPRIVAMGARLERVLWVRPGVNGHLAGWAADQLARSGSFGLIAILASREACRALDKGALRRLQLAAEGSGAVVLVVHEPPSLAGPFRVRVSLEQCAESMSEARPASVLPLHGRAGWGGAGSTASARSNAFGPAGRSGPGRVGGMAPRGSSGGSRSRGIAPPARRLRLFVAEGGRSRDADVTSL